MRTGEPELLNGEAHQGPKVSGRNSEVPEPCTPSVIVAHVRSLRRCQHLNQALHPSNEKVLGCVTAAVGQWGGISFSMSGMMEGRCQEEIETCVTSCGGWPPLGQEVSILTCQIKPEADVVELKLPGKERASFAQAGRLLQQPDFC